MSEYQIQDKTEIVETTYSQFVIEVQEIQLNVCAKIRVILYDSLKTKADAKYLTLLQPEYSNWGSDDNFIVNWVCNQLGLTLK